MKKQDRILQMFNFIKLEDESNFYKKIKLKSYQQVIEEPYTGNAWVRHFIGISFLDFIDFVSNTTRISEKQYEMIFIMKSAICIYPSRYYLDNLKRPDIYLEDIKKDFPSDKLLKYMLFIGKHKNLECSCIYYLINTCLHYFSKKEMLELASNWVNKESRLNLNGKYHYLLKKIKDYDLNYEETKILCNLFKDNSNYSCSNKLQALDMLDAMYNIKNNCSKFRDNIRRFNNFMREYYYYTSESQEWKEMFNDNLLQAMFSYYLGSYSNLDIVQEVRKYCNAYEGLINSILKSTNEFSFLNKGSVTQKEYKYLRSFSIPYCEWDTVEDEGLFYGTVSISGVTYKITH